MAAVIWKPIPGVDGYEASSDGDIRSVPRVVERIMPGGRLIRQPLAGRILAPAKCKNGYLYVNARGRTYQVHRLVARAWLSGDGEGFDVAHENNDRHDNRPANLRWATRMENIADQVAHGTRLRGERQNGARLTETDVRAMRAMRSEGASWSKIGKAFKVATMTAKNAVVGATWKHVA